MSFLLRDEYLTNIEEIDKQHKKLATLIDNLQRIANEDDPDFRKAKRVILFLGVHVRMHFSYEDEWLANHECQLSEKIKSINEDFLRLYQVLKNKGERKGIDKNLLEMLYEPARSWFIEHMSLTSPAIRKALEDSTLNPPLSIVARQIQKQSQVLSIATF